MKCKNCDGGIHMDEVGDKVYFYHDRDGEQKCNRQRFDEYKYAEPKIEIETHQGPKFGLCKHCGSNVEWNDEYVAWLHDDGYHVCHPKKPKGTVAEPEDPRPEFERACAYCGVTILWNEDIDFWVHDDGSILCSGGVRGVATPELPDEIAFKDGLGDEISVESNSRSEIGSSQNSGTKNGSLKNGSEKSGPPFVVSPKVTPPQTGGAVKPPLTLAFNHLVNTLYGMKEVFNEDQEERVVTDLENLEDAIYNLLDVVGSGSSMP